MLKFAFGLLLIIVGFGGALFVDPVWGLYLFAALTHIRLEQLGESIGFPLRMPIVIAALTMVLYIVSPKYRDKFSRWPAEVWLLAIMLVGMCVGSLQAEYNAPASWELTAQFAKYLLFFILFIHMVDSIKKVDQFHWVMILSAAWLVYRCWDLRGTTGPRFENFGGGTVSDSNHFAAALVLLFPFVLHKLLDRDRRIAIGAAFLSAGCLMAIIISGSRGAALGFAVLAGLCAIVLRAHRKKILTAMLALGVAGAMMINESQIERLKTVFLASHAEERDSSMQLRMEFWKLAFDLFRERPMFGVGAGNFAYYSGPRVEGLPPGTPGHVTHSIWFESISERGLVGTIPFLILLYRFFGNLRSLAHRHIAAGKPDMALYMQVPMLGMAGFLVAATFLDRLVYEPIYWCIGLGVIHRYMFQEAAAPSTARPVRIGGGVYSGKR